MAVPRQRDVIKRNRQREHWKKIKKEEKVEDITPEEHKERLRKLKEMGLIK